MPKKDNKEKEAANQLHEAAGFLTSVLQEHGFRQIVPPPVERSGSFEELDFGRLWEVGGDRVLAPTQIFNAYRVYEELIRESEPRVVKWFYISPVARARDAEEKHRFYHELGVFVFGKNSPMATAQLVSTAMQLFAGFDSEEEINCELNNLGCDTCAAEYQDILESHFVGGSNKLCTDCSTNLSQSVRKVLACQNQQCRQELLDAPQIVDFLDEKCRERLVGVLETLDEMEMPYVLNPTLYTGPLHERVVFRISKNREEQAHPLVLGGDLSGILKKFHEEAPPAVGFICELENLAEHLPFHEAERPETADVFVISLGDQGSRKALRLYRLLHSAGIRVAESMLANSGIKDQLKEAKKLQPSLALIIGQKEALDDTVLLRDMKSSMQETFTVDRVLEEVKKRLGD